MPLEYADAAKMIDHALLVPSLTESDLQAGCQLAAAYDVASVCIMPYYVKNCARLLAQSSVLPSTVIGFPHGGQTTATKVAEAKQAIEDGAIELDMVTNISAVLSSQWDLVADEIRSIVDLAHQSDRKVKVIFENCYLSDDQKRRLCEICWKANADWVKTSTGFGTGGATIEDLQLMLDCVQPPVQVKAAGGVRDLDTLLKVREMGVTRVGASATPAILDEARKRLGLPAIDAGEAQQTGY